MAHFSDEIVQSLLQLSDRAFDKAAKDMIRTWDSPPKAAQILEVLDMCVHGSLCSGFEIKVLEFLLVHALKEEGRTYNEVAEQGNQTWRKAYR